MMIFQKCFVLGFLLLAISTSTAYGNGNGNNSNEEESSEESESDQDEISESLAPDHTFDIQQSKYASGKKKGQNRITVSLEIPPFIFTRKKVEKDIALFTCNDM